MIGERIHEIIRLKKEAVEKQDFETAQKLRDEEIELEKQLGDLRDQINKKQIETPLSLTQNDIADIVASWTGIPVAKINESDAERLRTLEEELKRRVIGQLQQRLRSRDRAKRRPWRLGPIAMR